MAQLKNTKIDGTLEVTDTIKNHLNIEEMTNIILNSPTYINDENNIYRYDGYFSGAALNNNRHNRRPDSQNFPISFLTIDANKKVYLAEERYQKSSHSTGLQISTGVNLDSLYIPVATTDILGVVKLGKILSTDNNYYLYNDSNTYKTPLRLDGENAYVSIPKYPSRATTETFGGIKIGYLPNNKKYPIELDDDGKAYVNVNWENSDTHYTASFRKNSNSNSFSLIENSNTNGTVTINPGGGTLIECSQGSTNKDINYTVKSPNKITIKTNLGSSNNEETSTSSSLSFDITNIIKNTILNSVYPIGSIYMSVNNISPASFLGGTWESWGQGRVPVGVGEYTDNNKQKKNFSIGSTGGEYNHKLTENEMPTHNHTGGTSTVTPSITVNNSGENNKETTSSRVNNKLKANNISIDNRTFHRYRMDQ